jgi:predicted nucleic acid-binding protein
MSLLPLLFIIIDTSLLLELVPSMPTHPHHEIAVSFLNRLRSAALRGDVIPIIPYLVLEEFYFKICWVYLRSAAGQDPWKQYYKQNPQCISATIHPVLIEQYHQLQAFPMIILEPEDLSANPGPPTIADCMTDYIRQFNILPKDATILSEARRVGIFHVATLDRDFERADGFTVFLPMN